MEEKSWPKTGDKYFFVSDELRVRYGTVTDDVNSHAYARQTERRKAGNFFQTFEEAKEMADIAYGLFNF